MTKHCDLSPLSDVMRCYCFFFNLHQKTIGIVIVKPMRIIPSTQHSLWGLSLIGERGRTVDKFTEVGRLTLHFS